MDLYHSYRVYLNKTTKILIRKTTTKCCTSTVELSGNRDYWRFPSKNKRTL